MMEELLGAEMQDVRAEEILPDALVDESFDTDVDILNGGCHDIGIQYIDSCTMADLSQDNMIDNLYAGDMVERASVLSEELDGDVVVNGVGYYDKDDSSILMSGVENELLTPVEAPELDVPESDMEALRDKAAGLERESSGNEIAFKKKVCPTRHGCSGATYCDSCGSDYPY